jgi:hypothetical protein
MRHCEEVFGTRGSEIADLVIGRGDRQFGDVVAYDPEGIVGHIHAIEETERPGNLADVVRVLGNQQKSGRERGIRKNAEVIRNELMDDACAITKTLDNNLAKLGLAPDEDEELKRLGQD